MSNSKFKNAVDKFRTDIYQASKSTAPIQDFVQDPQYTYKRDRGYDPYYLVDNILRHLNDYARYSMGNYSNHHPHLISEALLSLFMNDKIAFEFFSQPDVIEEIIRLYDRHRPSRFDVSTKRNQHITTENEISDEDYEIAVSVVDELLERGIETLDDGELEILEENKEIIQKYESN